MLNEIFLIKHSINIIQNFIFILLLSKYLIGITNIIIDQFNVAGTAQQQYSSNNCLTEVIV